MTESNIDVARREAAPAITHCVVIGDGSTVRLAFLAGEDTDEPVGLVSAVTLTRSQLIGFAGMVASVLDSDDPYAVSVS